MDGFFYFTNIASNRCNTLQTKAVFYDKIPKTVVINYSSEECNVKSDYIYVGIIRRVIACIIDRLILMGIYLVFFLSYRNNL